MGVGDRAYNLLRAYIGREWERIEGARESSARDELNSYLNDPTVRAQEEISKAQRVEPKSDFEEALSVLGLKRGCSLSDLKRTYRRLSERSLPANFPEASEERKKATAIHDRVQWAYDILLPQLDPRLKRFQSLDL